MIAERLEMTWEQKLAALNALANCTLNMRWPGDWYVSAGSLGIANGSIVCGGVDTGRTPEEAVTLAWDRYTTKLGDDEAVCVLSLGANRYVRWNGFMWFDVPSIVGK